VIAELILIRKLLEKTPNGSTPSRAVLPKFWKKKERQRPTTITRKKSIGPALGLKKYF
tara:strand:+ start:212 stop:385 length:174 start_codon:yes stop_codon:yes gene_type:complete